jgi:hypothetical protein
VPAGWATVEQLWEALRDVGVETDRVTPRYLRVRLHALAVPSERRIVTRPIERVFPREEALRKLQADPKFVRQSNGISWWDVIPAKIEQRRKANEPEGK